MDKSKEFVSAFAICEEVLSCRTFDEIERRMLTPIASYLNAQTGAFIEIIPDDDGSMFIGRSGAIGVPYSAHEQYAQHFFRMDPAFKKISNHAAAQDHVFCTAEICDYAELTDGEFYNDFFRPIHVHHVLALNPYSDDTERGRILLGFHRPKNAKPFDEREKWRARMLVNATACALRGLSIKDELALKEETIHQFECANPKNGVVLLDEHFRVVHATKKGIEDMQLASASDSAAQGHLPRYEVIRNACRNLQNNARTDLPININLGGNDGIVAAVTVKQRHDGRLLFAIHTGTHETETALQQKCSNFGLTNREVDIARLLTAGLSNSEISHQLCISPRTVENHLRSIYSKAGVNRRTQLVSRIMV